MRFALISAMAALAAVPGHVRAAPAVEISGTAAVQWVPAPAFLPKGAQMAILTGDPSRPGPYVVRLKMPAGYQVPAHHHPTPENITVLSGIFHVGMGDKLDKHVGDSFTPGGFTVLPANMNHYAWASTQAVVQIHGVGPLEIVYANPREDPRRR